MTVRQFLGVVEIRTKVISVSTYILATLYVIADTGGFDLSAAIILAIAVLAVDMGTTAFNSFYDFARGVDVQGITMEPEKVLVHEGVAPASALIVSLVLYAIAVLSGFVLALQTSLWLLPMGFASMVVGFAYNGGPLPISRTPVGELFAGGFLGTVLFLVIVLAHVGSIDASDLVFSLPSTLIIASVLTVNNTCDMDGDRQAGRRTLSILLGRTAGSLVSDLLVVGAFAMVVWRGVLLLRDPQVSQVAAVGGLLLGLVAAFISIALLVLMHRRGFSHETKRPQMVSIIRIVMLYTIAYGGHFVVQAL